MPIPFSLWSRQSLHETQLFLQKLISQILLVLETLELLRKDALHHSKFLVSQCPSIMVLSELGSDLVFDFAPRLSLIFLRYQLLESLQNFVVLLIPRLGVRVQNVSALELQEEKEVAIEQNFADAAIALDHVYQVDDV